MSRVETGEVLAKLKGRPPIEYLRKLAPTEAEAQRYLQESEKAEVVRLSELGKMEELFEVYIPVLGRKVSYGLPGMNEIIEWTEANLDLGKAPKIDPKTKKILDPGKPANPTDQIKAMRKMAYLMLHKADKALTEEMMGTYSPRIVTQILVAITDYTPFYIGAQAALAASLTPKQPASPSQQ